jgi:hypothetical protein
MHQCKNKIIYLKIRKSGGLESHDVGMKFRGNRPTISKVAIGGKIHIDMMFGRELGQIT